jgi:hypothetical protein
VIPILIGVLRIRIHLLLSGPTKVVRSRVLTGS